MHKHWNDTPYDELPPRQAPERPEGLRTASSAPTPPPEYAEDARVPYMKLQGRWLRQMGFNVGSQLKIEASEGVITISIIGNPILPQHAVPRTLERRINFAEVKADTNQKIFGGDPR